MSFEAISKKINFDALKEESVLASGVLAKRETRNHELEAIIKGGSDRILSVIGLCSSDSEETVLKYAHRLAKLQEEVKDRVFMVMRVYAAEPCTNGSGYEGLMHQPDMSEAPSLINGIKAVRNLHYHAISETGLTTADEILYPENLPLIDDLVSYIATGAHSAEDQQYRFVASGISVPTRMKNPTSGNLNVMFNGIYIAQSKQSFLFNGKEIETLGSPLAHAILRSAANEYDKNVPNYYYGGVIDAIEQYEKMGLENPFIIIGTNHDNSGEQYLEQVRIIRQTLISRDWNEKISGYVRDFMVESYLEDGRQDAPGVLGKSTTGPCLGWENTARPVHGIYDTLSE